MLFVTILSLIALSILVTYIINEITDNFVYEIHSDVLKNFILSRTFPKVLFVFIIFSFTIISNIFIFNDYHKVYDLAPNKDGNYVSHSTGIVNGVREKVEKHYANFYSYQGKLDKIDNGNVKIVKSDTENATVEINKNVESFWFIDYKYNKEYIINIPNNTEIDKGEFELDEDKALLVKNRSKDNN